MTSPCLFHLRAPLRDVCFLYTNARIKFVIPHLKTPAAGLIGALSSRPSGLSPDRAGAQKDTLLLQINTITILCSTVHPHVIRVDYSALQTSAFQETSLKEGLVCKCVGAAALLCSGGRWNTHSLLWSTLEYIQPPEASRIADVMGELIHVCVIPPTYCSRRGMVLQTSFLHKICLIWKF